MSKHKLLEQEQNLQTNVVSILLLYSKSSHFSFVLVPGTKIVLSISFVLVLRTK